MVPEFLKHALASTERIITRDVFFIVGCQKSGTSWLQWLLDGHPQLSCSGEGHFTDRLAPMLEVAVNEYNKAPHLSSKIESDDLLAVLRLLIDRRLDATLSRAAEPGVVRAVGDKTPEAATALPVLDRLYPGAKFIHIIRDGRDGVVSGWAHLERLGQQGKFPDVAAYARYFAENHWAPYITMARRAEAGCPGRYREVRYEDLHTAPEAHVTSLLEFLNVDPREDAVRACLESGDFKRLSGGRARGEERRDSHFRKGVVGDWRESLPDSAVAAFEEAAGDLMQSLDYARTTAAAVS